MKQKLIALLKTSFASKGFNAKELESFADLVIAQNLITDESTDEDLAAAVTAAKPTADFVQSVSSRQVSDVKKPKVEDPQPAAPSAAAPAPADMPEWAKALVESNKLLAQGLEAIKGEKVVNTWKSQYEKVVDGTLPDYKAKALKTFDRLSSTFKNEDEFTSWLASEVEDAKAFVSPFQSDRPTGSAGKSAAVKEASKEEAATVLKTIM